MSRDTRACAVEIQPGSRRGMAEPMVGRKAPTRTHTSSNRHTTLLSEDTLLQHTYNHQQQEITRSDICESNDIYNLTPVKWKQHSTILTHAEFPDLKMAEKFPTRNRPEHNTGRRTTNAEASGQGRLAGPRKELGKVHITSDEWLQHQISNHISVSKSM